MTVEDGNREFTSDVPLSPVVVKRKPTGGKLLKRLQKTKQAIETRASTISVVPGAVKKLTNKRTKPPSKFARKKYVCPHCNRRFLTRGNVKNHLRIHSRDKPFQCPVCQVILDISCRYIKYSSRTSNMFSQPYRTCLLIKQFTNAI